MQPPLPPPPDQLGGMPSWRASEGETAPIPYAGFWARFAALLLDTLLLAPIALALLWPVFGPMIDEINRTIEAGGVFDSTTFIQRYQGRVLGASVLTAGVSYVYQAVMVGLWGATVGKFALRLRVRRTDGSVAGWREALLRPLLQVALTVAGSVAPVGLLTPLDYLWMLWDKQNQTLHDKVAGTIVVQQ